MKTRLVLGLLFLSGAALGMAGCGSETPAGGTQGAVTFWKDVAPIYNQKCVRCHQEDGIAPFALDNFADAKAHAAPALAQVTAGTMPPYFMVHDGSCGSFHAEAALTDKEKSVIMAWVGGAQAEGTPVTLTRPGHPALDGAVDIETPLFAPAAQGGQLAEFDEYRCFLIDPPITADAYLTGYDVTPGDPTIVHHLLAYVVDPAKLTSGGKTNAAVMQTLDAQSPDRLGWPCFGSAGAGVNVTGLPVTWAPGQGVVSYPAGMGVPIRSTDKLVVQVHYNLADIGAAGRSDHTQVHLRFAPSVERQLAFLLPDPFLESLGKTPPDSLPPQKTSTKYIWTQQARQLGVDGVPSVDLVAVMPHMHGRGVSQQLRLGPANDMACAANLAHWDFHWQEFYFYEVPPKITPDTQIEVTCEYDTSADVQPVLPGWGTRNEMCLAVMMVALPS